MHRDHRAQAAGRVSVQDDFERKVRARAATHLRQPVVRSQQAQVNPRLATPNGFSPDTRAPVVGWVARIRGAPAAAFNLWRLMILSGCGADNQVANNSVASEFTPMVASGIRRKIGCLREGRLRTSIKTGSIGESAVLCCRRPP